MPLGAMLSANLSWREFTATQHRDLDILRAQADPPDYVRINAVRHAADVWQPFRDLVGPVRVTSGYRCQMLNGAVGGAKGSAHLDGRATDNIPLQRSLLAAFERLLASDIPFDKAIWEYGQWIHLQSAYPGKPPRRMALMTFDSVDFPRWDPADPRIPKEI